jgi:hypothetical protein
MGVEPPEKISFIVRVVDDNGVGHQFIFDEEDG